ncbi:hypothetical protein G9P44_004120 [Scheffersomyces stipitis]|nr:hypothetical protein G9P44_004120 [Scheffersomyces stipitis]
MYPKQTNLAHFVTSLSGERPNKLQTNKKVVLENDPAEDSKKVSLPAEQVSKTEFSQRLFHGNLQ